MQDQRDDSSRPDDAAGVGGRLRRRRRDGGTPPAGGRSRFERVLFSFMGPPQLGDLNAPVREVTPGPVAPCPKCAQPYDEHEVVRDPRLTYTRCPPPRP